MLGLSNLQMAHVMNQECVLLAHDLGGKLENGSGALIEDEDQLIDIPQALGEEIALGGILDVAPPVTWAQ